MEVVVVSSIVLMIVAAVAISYQSFFALAHRAERVTQASLLLEEGAEALLVLRDLGWDEYIEPLALDTEYALVWDGGAYRVATTTPAGTYHLTVVLSEVRRNAADVVSTSGTVDPDTRRAALTLRYAPDGTVLAEGIMLIHNAYAE